MSIICCLPSEPPPMEHAALRHGGVPLMEAHAPWPRCAGCGRPLRFRAQVPLAVTLVAPPDDPRLLLVFECRGTGGCGQVHAQIVSGALAPRRPERASQANLAPRGARLICEELPPTRGTVWASVGPERTGSHGHCSQGHRLRSAVRLWPQRHGGEILGAVQVMLCLRCGEAVACAE